MLQAVLLSLGGLSFITAKHKTQHLEFNVDPADLHRDYQFRNIKFSNLTRLNLSVIVDESNYAVLHISSSSKDFYASDASLSPPVPLGSVISLSVVKLFFFVSCYRHYAYSNVHNIRRQLEKILIYL